MNHFNIYELTPDAALKEFLDGKYCIDIDRGDVAELLHFFNLIEPYTSETMAEFTYWVLDTYCYIGEGSNGEKRLIHTFFTKKPIVCVADFLSSVGIDRSEIEEQEFINILTEKG